MYYRKIIEALGLTVVEDAEVGETEGYWIAVVLDQISPEVMRGGLLIQDFGSCPHCDEWMAAADVTERLAVAGRMIRSITWFGNPVLFRSALVSQSLAWADCPEDPQAEFLQSAINTLRLPTWTDVYNAYVRAQGCLEIECDREHPDEVPGSIVEQIEAIGREVEAEIASGNQG